MTDTLAHFDTTSRNTNNRRRCWGMTWNNYTEEELKQTIEYFQVNCKDYRINREIGKKTGTPHLQIAVNFKNARYWGGVKRDFPKCNIKPADNWCALINYCSKDATRVGDTIVMKNKADPFYNKTPLPWQQDVIDFVNNREADDRTIHWFVDTKGNRGKTSLAKHLVVNNKSTCLYVGGKAKDIKYAVANFVKKKKLKIVIFGYPRTTEGYVSYQALEEIKDGIFFSGKYESECVVYESPHVFVFANWWPDTSTLTEDRWNVVNLDAGERLSSFVDPNTSILCGTHRQASGRNTVETMPHTIRTI